MSNRIHLRAASTSVRVARAATTSLRTNAVTVAVGFGVEQACHTAELVQGSITPREYGRRTVVNAAGSAGGLGGAAAGATLGTFVCPGIGTALGALLGGILGSWGLAAGARSVL